MIKLENVVLASPEQMEFIIEGMRNPMNSWAKGDSEIKYESWHDISGGKYEIGPNDHSLMQRLSIAGTEHRKYMRMMPVYVRITAPLYWWKEFDTYKVGTVANSCSTMHKIQAKEFDRGDFSHEHIPKGSDAYSDTWDMKTSSMFFPVNIQDGIYFSSEDVLDFTIQALNHYREKYLVAVKTEPETGLPAKDIWWQMVQLLPSSYNQTRNVMLNYEVLANIYRQRQNHKLDEWREVCKWIETLPYSELITEGEERKLYSDTQVLAETGQELKRGLRAGIRMVDENDTKCNRCEKLRDCLNSGGLVDVTTGNDITKGRYINKPGYDCPKRRKNNER